MVFASKKTCCKKKIPHVAKVSAYKLTKSYYVKERLEISSFRCLIRPLRLSSGQKASKRRNTLASHFLLGSFQLFRICATETKKSTWSIILESPIVCQNRSCIEATNMHISSNFISRQARGNTIQPTLRTVIQYLYHTTNKSLLWNRSLFMDKVLHGI